MKKANLSRVANCKGANFSGVKLIGTNLNKAKLINTDLTGTALGKNTSFDNCIYGKNTRIDSIQVVSFPVYIDGKPYNTSEEVVAKLKSLIPKQ